jgi:putative ABC transport system permease protein
MGFLDTFDIALNSLTRNKVRSFLTMLGIIIGVGAVIAMMAVGTGAQESIKQQIASLGTNVILIFPGPSIKAGSVPAQERPHPSLPKTSSRSRHSVPPSALHHLPSVTAHRSSTRK